MIKTNDSNIFKEMDFTECFCKICSVNYPEDRMNIKFGAKNYNNAYKNL